MFIFVVGAGEVGTEIAAKLAREDHDVTVIDKSPAALEKLANLDVMTVQGNGANLDLLESAGLKKCDLLIAVTQIDEINIMACLLGKSNGAKKTIARVRQNGFGNEYRSITDARLGIDAVINPELVAATEIVKIVKNTSASELDFFAKGKIQLLGFRLNNTSPMVNKALKDLEFQHSLVVGISRNNTLLIPRGDEILLPSDHVYLLCETGQHYSYEWLTGRNVPRMHSIFIMGAGKVGRHSARLLSRFSRLGVRVKLIEQNLERCKEVAAILPDVLVLNGSGTDMDFLVQEDIANTDVFIAVSGNDEVNILSALLAKKLGAKRVIAEVNRPDYAMLVETLDIDVAIRPRLLAAGMILKMVRKGSVVSVTILGEDQAEIVEMDVGPASRVAGRKLMDMNLPNGLLVGAVLRKNELIIPRGDDQILAGDRIVLFVRRELTGTASAIFSG